MDYLKKSFSVGLGGKDFAEGWERTFGAKKDPSPEDKAKAAELRKEADRLWEAGDKEGSSKLHEEARKLGG